MNLLIEAVAATWVTVLELHGMILKMLYIKDKKIRIHRKFYAEWWSGICADLVKLLYHFYTVLFQNMQKKSFFHHTMQNPRPVL
jgi:hypothetical protein